MLKTAAVYLVLVGAPLLGMFAVLHWGASLQPPAHIGGAWSVEQACSAVPTPTELVVDQSGKFLRAKLSAGVVGRGRLEGDRITATVVSNVGACSGEELAVDARVEGERLVGTIRGATCSACPASTFVAGRDEGSD